MNLSTEQKQNHRHREPIGGCQMEEGSGRNGVEGEGVWSEFRALRFDISRIELYWFVKLSWVKLWTQAAMRSGEK